MFSSLLKSFLFLWLVFCLMSCFSPQPKVQTESENTTLASPVLDEEKRNLIMAGKVAVEEVEQKINDLLSKALEEKGLLEATEFCSEQSVKMTVLQNSKHPQVLDVGRSSHQLRNFKNAPSLSLDPWLEQMKSSTKEKPSKNKLFFNKNEKAWYYVKPIYVESSCLVCHGEKISPELTSFLDRKYSQDQARDYKEGDFRGVFWVKLKSNLLDHSKK